MARSRKQKHIPQRTCVACRTKRPKRELIRVVRTPDGSAVVDETGKQGGRGAYLCPSRECWQKALSGAMLNKALRVSLTEEAKARLSDYAASF